MFLPAIIFFDDSEEDEEEQVVSRRQLRDNSNVLDMTPNQFVANFCVSKEIFVHILDILKDKWSPRYRSTHIRPDIKLGAFLHFLATGSYQRRIENDFSPIGRSSVQRIIAECLQQFEENICPLWIKMPQPQEESKIIDGFFDRTGFPGVLGCVDGTHIRIKCPSNDTKHLYYNKNGYCSINAMMICDHKMNIIYVDARHPGDNDDTFIWETSLVNEKLQESFKRSKRNSWILGDGEYKLKPFLLTPFKFPKDACERRFNAKHTDTHCVVKECFGVLKSRLRCLLGGKGLYYSPKKATKIVNACCAVHNMCLKYMRSQYVQVEIEVHEETAHNDDNNSEDEEENEEDITATAIRRKIAISL